MFRGSTVTVGKCGGMLVAKVDGGQPQRMVCSDQMASVVFGPMPKERRPPARSVGTERVRGRFHGPKGRILTLPTKFRRDAT